MDHLRTFGCASYVHVAKDERQKLDSKATKCVLLGYGSETKGYRLYNLKRLKVFYSRDVLFCESERGFEKERSVQERRYVEIDCSRDEEPVYSYLYLYLTLTKLQNPPYEDRREKMF